MSRCGASPASGVWPIHPELGHAREDSDEKWPNPKISLLPGSKTRVSPSLIMATRKCLSPLIKAPKSIANSICHQCQRSFVTTPTQLAGHNKWSKTKHIKAVTDKKKMTERSNFTKTIAMYSRSRHQHVRVHGPKAFLIFDSVWR